MTCEQALNFVSARLDGEISPEDTATLEAHLADCADCRSAAESSAIRHGQLLRAFAPRRRAAAGVADRAVARIAHERRSRLRWPPALIAAAAGFLLAVMVFRPWTKVEPVVVKAPETQPSFVQTRPESNPTPQVAVLMCAQLSLTTGKVELRPPGDGDWRAMETGGSVPANARVRTGPGVRCEFNCPDGSLVRLNENSELHFAGPRKLELADGQVWSGVAKAETPFTVAVASSTVTALGTRFDVSRTRERASLIVFEGATRVRSPSGEAHVNSGEGLDFSIDGQLDRPRRVGDLARAARWIDELLVRKGRDNPELASHIDDLLAQLGNEKMHYLYENEIRGLGDHCVLPLTRYVQSDRSAGDPERRRRAANIASDSAQPWCIPYLIELLNDRDGEVRAAAGRGLNRLTRYDLGTDTEWRSTPESHRQDLVRRWQRWWEENKDHVPGANDKARESDAPAKATKA